MDKKEIMLELNMDQMVEFVNHLREDVIVKVTFEENGGDEDDGRKTV